MTHEMSNMPTALSKYIVLDSWWHVTIEANRK